MTGAADDAAVLDAIDRALRKTLQANARRPIVLGLCGAQGSGKSTLAAILEQRLKADGLSCASLSLDDFYKTHAERRTMAREVHPLFATRGVPGTHDMTLAFRLFDALARGQARAIPRFDKARDDRAPEDCWDEAPVGLQVLIFEGWFVGARPQAEGDLAPPVNALERSEDPDIAWRRHANAALAADYQRLFARIDLLILLAAPTFEVVEEWRREQEEQLRTRGSGGMEDADIGRFVQHYERLTRHILTDMANYADLVIALDLDRSVRKIALRA